MLVNKYIMFMIMLIYLIIMTITVGSIGMTTTTEIIGGIPTEQSASILSVFGFLGTFFRILSFQIVGIPEWVTVIFFWPVTAVFAYLIIDVVKDIIPLT